MRPTGESALGGRCGDFPISLLLGLSGFLLSTLAVVHASPPLNDSVPFCLPIDFDRERQTASAKRLADLNVGAPRTVRLVYFLPNDRPFRVEVEDSMKASIRRIQTFFAEQMQAHGHGDKTFRFETDGEGEPLVHRFDGQHPDTHYISNGSGTGEIGQVFDLHENIYFVVFDYSTGLIDGAGGRGSRSGKVGGMAQIPAAFTIATAAHELGHAFGLDHDFRDSAYLMSYGSTRVRLSACAAAFLAVHPYFNTDVPTESGPAPAIELLSPTEYPEGANSVSVQLKVSASEGLHQVSLLVPSRADRPGLGPALAAGFPEIKSCRDLADETETLVEFEYDGIVPSSITNLSHVPVHPIRVQAVDQMGNVTQLAFSLVKTSSDIRIATIEAHGVTSVALSPDGAVLALGRSGSQIGLWDVAAERDILTLNGGHSGDVTSLAFSPDGATLASGAALDVRVQLWDLTTGTNVAALEGHTEGIISVTISPDGTVLASKSWDGTVRLWDLATATNITTLSHGVWHPIAFSADGATLVLGSEDTVELWSVETGETDTVPLEGHSPWGFVALSPGGTTLVSGSLSEITLWDVETGALTTTLPTEVPGVLFQSGTLSPDGTLLASGLTDDTIMLWDLTTGMDVATLVAGTAFVELVAFSSDGQTLASWAGRSTIELWDASGWTGPRPRRLVTISGDGQQGQIGAPLDPLVVEVRDQNDNPLPGVQVTFTVTVGDGRLSDGFTLEKATTGSDGRAVGVLTLGRSEATTVEGSVDGLEPVRFRAVTVGTPPAIMDGDFQTWHLPDGAVTRLMKGRLGRSDQVVAYSPDGQCLAVASSIGIWLYETRSTRPLALLPTRTGVHAVSFSPDGRTLASSQESRTIQLWDVAAGTPVLALERRGRSFVRFSPDGTTLAFGVGSSAIGLWNVEDRTHVATLGGHTDNVLSVAFSPDGATLASASEDGTVALWDVATGGPVPFPSGRHPSGIESVAFSPDGNLLAYGARNALQLWDVASSTRVTTGLTSTVASVAFSPDGATLAAGLAEGAVQLWDVAASRAVAALRGHLHWVRSVAFSPDGATLASASEDDGTIRLWDVATANAAALKEHAYRVNFVRLSPDGAMLAVGSIDRVTLWNVTTGNATQVLVGDEQWLTTAAFSPDGGTLAVPQGAGVRLWDLETGTHIILEAEHRVSSVGYSPNGTTLGIGLWDGTVQLWSLETGRTVATTALEGHSDGPMELAFLPDGTLLASGAEDGMVRLWDVSTGVSLADLDGASVDNSMSFSPDGTVFATETPSSNLQLWDVTAGRRIATLEHRWVNSLAFSPGGTLLASGADGGAVKLWNVSTGANLASLEGHRKAVHTVSFSPDGMTLASGGDDGTVLLWDLQLILPHPQTLTKLSGDMQRGPAGSALAEPFVVAVLDQNGDPFAGATVTFAVTSGGGTLSAAAASTDARGRAASTLTLGDVGTNTIQITVVGLEPVTYTATAEATPDFNGDGVTDFSDFFLFAQAFGGSDLRFDLDGSGTVDFADFFLFAEHFGQPARTKLVAMARDLIGLPDGPQLRQNAPNPFNGATVISWFQLQPARARLEVFALTGQRVAVLTEDLQKAGSHRLRWDGRDQQGRPLASGVYVYRLVTAEAVQTRKLTLLR